MRSPVLNRLILAIFVLSIFAACSKLERGVPEDMAEPSVLLTAPNGGEVWYLDTEYNITWEATDDVGIVSCKLDYSLDGGLTWVDIQDSIEGNPGVFAWTVPDTVSTRCLVRVSCQDMVENINSDTSDAVFTVWPQGGMIAFSSDRDNTGVRSIFMMYANGDKPQNITNMSGSDYDVDVDWSPDCSRLAYRKYIYSPSDHEIFVMNLDGNEQTNITNSPTTVDVYPAWSPLGDRIAFSSIRGGADYDIWLMDPDGTNLSILTSTSDFHDSYPSWSPSGDQIAFQSNRGTGGGTYDVYTMNSDGSDPQRLTTDQSHDAWPAWSPDGSLIAFCTDRHGLNEIYTMNANGSNPQRITNNSATDFWPRWSPDANRIVFMSDRTGDYEIWIMDADGGNPVNISNNLARDDYASWSPIH
jgi:Tol biopolymer transport system component